MKFKLFDMNRDGLGVEKGEDTTPNVSFFFTFAVRFTATTCTFFFVFVAHNFSPYILQL